MLAEPTEGEEAFFHYENGLMAKVKGYYIYYEKNAAMQEYMVQKNQILKPEFTEKCSDEAVTTFRKIIQEKRTKATKQRRRYSTLCFFLCSHCMHSFGSSGGRNRIVPELPGISGHKGKYTCVIVGSRGRCKEKRRC